MNQSKQIKINQVKEIKDKLSKAHAIVIVEYSGLSVKQLQLLRKELKTKNVELSIYKNRLFKIAADEVGLSALSPDLVGQNAYAFGYSDDISPAKILAKFAKENQKLKLKIGTYEGKVVSNSEILKISQLPSYEEALLMLARQLISPIKFIGVGLHQLIEEGKLPSASN